MIIAIDAQRAGKSTVAKAVARELGFSCSTRARCPAPSPGGRCRTGFLRRRRSARHLRAPTTSPSRTRRASRFRAAFPSAAST
ncbi:MAG: hypothetical protein ACLR3C_03335 [Eggerthella lenta]